MNPYLTLILGALITLVTIFIQHLLSVRQIRFESKKYPSQFLYEKQFQFYIILTKDIQNLIFILKISLDRVKNGDIQNVGAGFKEFTDIKMRMGEYLEEYDLFIPSALTHELKNFYFTVWNLPATANEKEINEALNKLKKIYNLIRKQVGVDAISYDMQVAFGNYNTNSNTSKI